MVVPERSGRRKHKYLERPPGCLVCGLHSWWCGWRETKAGARRRARCSDPCCEGGSFTVYEADAYPHRRVGLAAVVAVVAAVAAGCTRTAAAAVHGVSRRSATRWVRWVAGLVEQADLARLCVQLHVDGLAPRPCGDDEVARARATLLMAEEIADQTLARGAQILGEGRGLLRLLSHQLRRFRDVFYLTIHCPRLRVDPEAMPP
jgi:hypothetical protein